MKEKIVNKLQTLYDNNSLSEEDEITILDTIEFLGGEVCW